MPPFEWKAVGDEPGCRQTAAAMDSQIKLFGQTISVSPSHTGAGADAGVLNPPSAYTAPPSSQDGGDSVHCAAESKGASEKLVTAAARCSSGDELFQLHMKGSSCGMAPTGVSQLCDEQSEGGVSDERDSHSMGSDGKSHQQKAEKVVACPRCSSQDTKFCYYNNYNVNQPRHFCKNCQRYWTAGGTLRNVPVGAGRRKNKASGGVHQQGRESSDLTSASFQMELTEFSCGVGSPKPKLAQPKGVPGQGSPVRSPGSSGQDSGITTYSLYQNGRLPFQSFIGGSQDFTASEISAVGSSDTASTRRLLRLPSGNGGLDLECSRSSRSEHRLDSAAHLRVVPQSVSLRESLESGWAGSSNNNGGQPPVRFFNGEWPNGYPVDWDRKHHQHPVGAPVLTNFSNASSVPTPAPWVSSTPWATTAGQPWAQHSAVGKRQGERLEDSLPAKTLRADVEPRSKWPMLQGKSSSLPAPVEVMQLLQPKLQPADEVGGAFMTRLFNNARRVPFPVTI